MKAARYYDQKDIRIEEISEQPLLPGTARIKVAWCGICGTDLHEFLEGPLFVPEHHHPHPVSGEDSPVTLGHEMSGVITEVAEDVTDLTVGDHVVVEPYLIHDDVDTSEANPFYHLSRDMNFIGLAGGGGGLSENIVVKRRWIHKISPDLPLDEAALIEPLSVGYHAVERAGFASEEAAKGKVALVGGAGPIGLLTASVLKAFGATVVISELSPLRRKKALDSGAADYALNPAEVDVVEEIAKLTDGKGADVAFECTSVQVVLDTLMDAVRPGAVIVVVSIWSKRSNFDIHKLVMKEIDLRGTIAYSHAHPNTIKLVESGKINLKPFITGKIALQDIVDKGFDTLINHNETAVKILVSPSGAGL
ncbi:2,3-butanediol dehydrogenase [Corynebacterium diphtheriae]|uniref:2,3-butanediol dehydrogenase n=1 Tax=Corynebacterium diphtheriae TaxID=1717 RepID=UPI00095C0513|nr:2,3-butanediol dehydrogenase [Corynebacterium diphtheriae]MBG9276468.1 2,3-butanediol dehydrogenase [Corynebacterium diphtheriae bv. mitis]MBG9280758.1 2,3-butanediol dehydrogenase [Corynebacterium diphtheriae bv. mitis]MBG9339086.1 2,3-butanediol dehydrogenase [Corynebacterium diphtheriae bv. mitis]OLN16903.1 2,3-butanediol dehydrogenase [Corynebacterium diphtheriae]OMO45637.1 2,3-butanediol dehydrogenase [Corynebacterium diphtheriae]